MHEPDAPLSYEEVRNLVLSYYADACKNHAKAWTHEQVLAWVSDEYENAFSEPLHVLMRELTMLGLTHGWHPALRDFHFNRCTELVASLDLPEALLETGLEKEEAEELMNDLKILGVLKG